MKYLITTLLLVPSFLNAQCIMVATIDGVNNTVEVADCNVYYSELLDKVVFDLGSGSATYMDVIKYLTFTNHLKSKIGEPSPAVELKLENGKIIYLTYEEKFQDGQDIAMLNYEDYSFTFYRKEHLAEVYEVIKKYKEK